MDDDLKISKVEYLSNHWSDHTQIQNVCSGNITEFKSTSNTDNLKQKISATNLTLFWSLNCGDQTKVNKASNEDKLQWKTT